MLEERGGSEQDKKALKNFLGYVEKGGTLMIVPVSQEVAEAFEEKLQKTDILSCRTQLRTSPGIYQYIYKAEDQRFMDLLIEEMKKDGHQLIESFNLEIKDLMQHADGHGVVGKKSIKVPRKQHWSGSNWTYIKFHTHVLSQKMAHPLHLLRMILRTLSLKSHNSRILISKTRWEKEKVKEKL